MESLPVEIFGKILKHLTLSDWKCLRLTGRSVYKTLSSISSYSHHRPIVVTPHSIAGVSLLEKDFYSKDVDHLSLTNIELDKLQTLFQKSEVFSYFLRELQGLSFAGSSRLIDSGLFYELLDYCTSLQKLDLSNYQFFFLTHKFTKTAKKCFSVTKLNLNNNTHLSDYAFNCLIDLFPNLTDLHIKGIPLRSSLTTAENRTFLTFENVCSFIHKNYQNIRALSISFERNLSCDAQLRRLFSEVAPSLNYLHVDGNLTVSTLQHLLILFEDRLRTLIIGHIVLDHTGCKPLFASISEYASSLEHLCVFLNWPKNIHAAQQHKVFLPVFQPSSDISLTSLTSLNDLDIQTVYSLSEIDIMHLFKSDQTFRHLKKLALPRNTTDEVIKILCTQSACRKSVTHLNLDNCPSLSNRTILLINKHLTRLTDLSVNYNVNITDFAFIGMSICGIGKAIEWLDHTMIEKQFIDGLTIWSCTVTHQTPCRCELPNYLSSSCIKIRLKDFNFEFDDNSSRILSTLIEHELFDKYFYSINNLKLLKTLKLRQCINLTNRLFRFAFRCLPDLKLLDLSGCDKLNDQHLSMMGQACPSIESIDFSGCTQITDVGRQALLKNAKRLLHIEA